MAADETAVIPSQSLVSSRDATDDRAESPRRAPKFLHRSGASELPRAGSRSYFNRRRDNRAAVTRYFKVPVI